MKVDIRKSIYNIDLVIESINNFPQTYKTILQHEYKTNTLQTILRRKLSKLCKQGVVFKTTIPGTRFGEVIFYSNKKQYYILVEGDRISSNVFCFFHYEKIKNFYIKVNEYHILKKGVWIKHKGEKTYFEGNVLKFL